MKTQDFLNLLNENPEKELLFEYHPGIFVPANYHITEIKNISVESVDCGAKSDSWNETIIQLYESPDEIGKKDFMKGSKAMQILSVVDNIKPMDRNAEVRFEYGNAVFHTAQLFVDSYIVGNDKLVMKLVVKKTECKAKEACGIAEPATITASANCCTPGSGCC